MQRLPKKLKRKIISFERMLLLSESIFSVAVLVLAVGIPCFFLFVFDRFADTAKFIRAMLLAVSLTSVAYAAWFWLSRWIFKRRTYSEISKIIQRKYKKLGDRLQGAIELSYDRVDDMQFSEELREVALRQVASDAEEYDFLTAINKRKIAKFAIVGALFIVVFLLLAKFANPALLNSVRRFLNPLSDESRFTFTVLKDLPEKMIVPMSEPFNFEIKLDKKSLFSPDTVQTRLNSCVLVSTFLDGKFKFNFNGISEQARLFVRAGDFKGGVNLFPLYRPSPEEFNVEIIFPKYIGGCEKRDFNDNALRMLEGSSFLFSGKYSRELSSVTVKYLSDNVKTLIAENSFKIEKALSAQMSQFLEISVTDIYGLEQKIPSRIKVETLEDKAPKTNITGLARSVAILPSEVIELKFSAEDDYGLQSLNMDVAVFAKNGEWISEKKFQEGIDLVKPAPLSFGTNYIFSPQVFDIVAGRLIVLRLAALDALPGREKSFSDEKYIYVLTEEEHFKLLVDKLRETARNIENLRDSEKDSVEKNRKFSGNRDGLNEPADDKNLASLFKTEDLNRLMAEKICEDGAEILKESLKNKSFDKKTTEKWAELFSELAELAGKDFKETSKLLQKALESRNSRKDNLKLAENTQDEIIKKLNKLIEETETGIAESFAINFAARLRKEAEKERILQGELKDTLKRSVGMSRENASPEIINELEKHATFNEQIGGSVREINYDMSGLFRRLPLDAYNVILKSMDEEKIDAKFSETENSISQNRLSDATMKSNQIEIKLEQWAEILEATLQKKASNSSCSTKVPVELSLELMRALLKEGELRKKTRELDKRRVDLGKHKKESLELSNNQDTIKDILAAMSAKYGGQIANLKENLQRVAIPMTDAGIFLAEGKTGQDSIAAETEAIEILAGILSGMTKESAMMAMMAGAVSGNSPGFGMVGDSSSRNSKVEGEIFRAKDAESIVDKGFVASEFHIPPRFRAFYESYIKKIEGENLSK